MAAEPVEELMTPEIGPQGLPRLLQHADSGVVQLSRHLAAYGPPPWRGLTRRHAPGPLVETVAVSGLRGRGGAGFPVAVKMRTVAQRPGGVVIANGAEGEPASNKDRLLLQQLPHLVLDGVQLAAEAVRARRVVLYVTPRNESAARRAIDERAAAGLDHLATELFVVPERFVSGESSAVVRAVSGGPALPAFTLAPSAERGVDRKATLVLNVETLAHVALIARYGAAWFRSLGTEADPGTTLISVCGDAARPGVYEIAHGTPLRQLLSGAGAPPDPPGAVLLGGYHGTWLCGEKAMDLRLAPRELRAAQSQLGPGIVAVLEPGRCPIREAAPVLAYLAEESAGQCGPCLNGLPAIADAFQTLATGRGASQAVKHLHRWTAMIAGRGACHHPDGAGRFTRSLLAAFAAEVSVHERGGCTATSRRPPVLPLPGGSA